jgi:hypothetical protein
VIRFQTIYGPGNRPRTALARHSQLGVVRSAGDNCSFCVRHGLAPIAAEFEEFIVSHRSVGAAVTRITLHSPYGISNVFEDGVSWASLPVGARVLLLNQGGSPGVPAGDRRLLARSRAIIECRHWTIGQRPLNAAASMMRPIQLRPSFRRGCFLLNKRLPGRLSSTSLHSCSLDSMSRKRLALESSQQKWSTPQLSSAHSWARLS